MLDWIASNPELAWSIAGAIYLGGLWALKAWAIQYFEPKKKELSPEENRLDLDGKARAVLATPILHEHAKSTATEAINSTAMWDRIEHVTCNSVVIREYIDRRASHALNNYETTLTLTLTKLGDQLSEGFRKQMSESQMMYMEALGDLKEAIQAVASDVKGHIIADEVRREADRNK